MSNAVIAGVWNTEGRKQPVDGARFAPTVTIVADGRGWGRGGGLSDKAGSVVVETCEY